MDPRALDLSPQALEAFLTATKVGALAPDLATRADIGLQTATDILGNVASEARLACGLLAGLQPTRTTRMLEVGAGAGLATAFLHRQGADLVAIEPSVDGFGAYDALRALLAERITMPTIEALAADELSSSRQGRFELIFSINVLEHMHPLERNLDALADVLASNGRMLHTCPNYRIPYEPHYGIPLVPGWPALTGLVARRRSHEATWNSLNWITAGDVRRFTRRHGLILEFRPGQMDAVLDRLRSDEAFARRQQGPVVRALRSLDGIGFTRLLARLPAAWMTPMTFVAMKPA